MERLGIDIGGTGIKGALVDVDSGRLTSARVRILTPSPATPAAVAGTAAEVADAVLAARAAEGGPAVPADVPVGIGFPGVVVGGTAHMAFHLHPDWRGHDAVGTFSEAMRRPATVLNDADAAGLAEVRFGAAVGRSGTVILITIGTGLGSAVFIDGVLVPNTELGHLEIDGGDAELIASETARIRNDWSWKRYARGLQRYLEVLHRTMWPELIVLGGGGSKKADRFLPFVEAPCEVVVAALGNEAGIVGAACAAAAPPS